MKYVLMNLIYVTEGHDIQISMESLGDYLIVKYTHLKKSLYHPNTISIY